MIHDLAGGGLGDIVAAVFGDSYTEWKSAVDNLGAYRVQLGGGKAG